MDAVFPNPELEAFAPDVIYIHTGNRNMTTCLQVADIAETVDSLLQAEVGKFIGIWDWLASVYHCPAIQNTERSGSFLAATFSKDDLKWNDMYREKVKRTQLEAGFAGYNEYLLSPDMTVVIKPFEPVYPYYRGPVCHVTLER